MLGFAKLVVAVVLVAVVDAVRSREFWQEDRVRDIGLFGREEQSIEACVKILALRVATDTKAPRAAWKLP